MRQWFRLLVGTMLLLPVAGVACGNTDPRPAEELGIQQSALGPPNSCFSYCNGQAPAGCWCDSACTRAGDCCSDYSPQCVGGGSCANNCTSGRASGGNCYCDEQCTRSGDCCADYASRCPDCGVTTRSWRAPTVLESRLPPSISFPPATEPEVGVAANGDAVAIWKYTDVSTVPATRRIRSRRYTGSAAAWSSMTPLGVGDVSPHVEVGNDGSAFATFGTQEWAYRPGSGWSNAALAATPVAVALDGAGNEMLLFKTGTNLDARRLTAVGVLEASRRLSSNATDFDVAGNAAGDFAAVYNIGPMLVLGVKSPGVDWGGTDFASSGSSPRVGIDASRNLHVVWIDGRQIKARRVLGTSVGAPVTIASYAEAVSVLKLASNSRGQAIVSWKRDFPAATPQILAAVFNPASGWSAPALVAETCPPESTSSRLGDYDVGIDECGAGQLVYESYYYSAYAARYTPATGWMAATHLAGTLRSPRLATAANGVSTVVWDGEFGDVHAARFE